MRIDGRCVSCGGSFLGALWFCAVAALVVDPEGPLVAGETTLARESVEWEKWAKVVEGISAQERAPTHSVARDGIVIGGIRMGADSPLFDRPESDTDRQRYAAAYQAALKEGEAIGQFMESNARTIAENSAQIEHWSSEIEWAQEELRSISAGTSEWQQGEGARHRRAQAQERLEEAQARLKATQAKQQSLLSTIEGNRQRQKECEAEMDRILSSAAGR